MSHDDLLQFIDEPADSRQAPASGREAAGAVGAGEPWRVLVVDDDPDVHETTRFALQSLMIAGRPLELLHAHSAAEALSVLRTEPDIAVILLDVVMETDDAGLGAVDAIRSVLGLQNVRIILRTGQPGQAPEIDTIQRYDINDYKTKSELTRTKLYTALTTAIRSFDQLRRLEASRRGLEKIISASNQFIAEQGLQTFAEGVITQIAGLMGIDPAGVVCACVDSSECSAARAEAYPVEDSTTRYRVIAAAGEYRELMQRSLAEIPDDAIASALVESLSRRETVIGEHSITLFFSGRDGHDFAAHVASAMPLKEIDQHLLKVFCTNMTLCAANVELVERLHDFAFVDRLLHIPNRTALIEAIDARARGGELAGQAVALVDIDRFAETNDMFGHYYGDMLLTAIARRLEAHLPEGCMLSRVAGDTFAVLGSVAAVSPDSLMPVFDAPFEIDGLERQVSVCMGFVRCDEFAVAGRELLKDASIALKRAKAEGPGHHEYYSPSISAETREHTQLLHGLQQAFSNDRLAVFYQPQVALDDGRVVGMEALLRWRDEDGRFIPPDRFIPVAEQSGLIVPLGAWVLRTALRAQARIIAAGLPALRVAVNVSPAQFSHSGFLSMLDEALADTGVSPAGLELEVTESVSVMGMSRVAELLAAIRARGIEIAIDDFGTGYSSLSYIDCLPADRLKIDRSFVNILDSDRRGARIAEMIVPLGRQLGMRVLAEGVESEAQAAALRDLDCQEAQGYLYARPMPLEDLLIWLKEREGQK